ncbi:peptidylprolyl isomerase [Oceanobacillus halotolerans]|uniref:peptidylprolyl isomerase n=1 Tax=Oceanobacillus halotolerans TaxID=2663380 RepID=UPI0013DC67AF|nr:peptidylprolyl isomerase [Oceanobacillus halotolerans]
MSRNLLLSIIVVLVMTNVTTLILWNNEEDSVRLGQDNSEMTGEDVVATVNDQDITFEEWHEILRQDYGEQSLKQMIDRMIVQQLAEEEGIEVSDKVIEREIALLKTTQGVMTSEEAQEKEGQWRKDIIYRYQLEALLTKDQSIPESELREYYGGYSKQYDFQGSMQLSHILVEDMETAEKVKEELDQGASFTLLAEEYSIDEETQENGGYLGFFVNTSQFIPTGYSEVALEMDENSYSEPIQTDNGVAIIYLHQLLPSITFTFEELKPYIESELAFEKLDVMLSADSLWNKVDIDWVYED